MESIPPNRILNFNPNQLESVRKQYNLEKPGDMSRAIDVLEEWIKMQKHFMKKEFPRNYLEKVILASKGSLERAKNRLDKICTYRTAMPNFFGDNVTKNRFDDFDEFKSTILPKPTDENYRIYFLKAIGSTFNSDAILNFYRYVVMICEYVIAYDYSDGFIVVIDYNDANLVELIKALNLNDMRQIIAIVTEGYGMRLKGIHLLTPSKAIDAFVALVKQFISPKLGKRICVHKDISTLFNHLPKDILPMEYGGKEKSVGELQADLMDEITRRDFISYVEVMNDAKTDESYREVDKFNEEYLGMPGSFRTLNVD